MKYLINYRLPVIDTQPMQFIISVTDFVSTVT